MAPIDAWLQADWSDREAQVRRILVPGGLGNEWRTRVQVTQDRTIVGEGWGADYEEAAADAMDDIMRREEIAAQAADDCQTVREHEHETVTEAADWHDRRDARAGRMTP